MLLFLYPHDYVFIRVMLKIMKLHEGATRNSEENSDERILC
jgi:hypothetical protein